VLRDDLYLIKVNSIKKVVVLDKNNKIRVEVAVAFSKENKTTITKIIWLSRKESAKAYRLIVVYLTKGTNT
jgi:preprotein translocase subunit SecE